MIRLHDGDAPLTLFAFENPYSGELDLTGSSVALYGVTLSLTEERRLYALLRQRAPLRKQMALAQKGE